MPVAALAADAVLVVGEGGSADVCAGFVKKFVAHVAEGAVELVLGVVVGFVVVVDAVGSVAFEDAEAHFVFGEAGKGLMDVHEVPVVGFVVVPCDLLGFVVVAHFAEVDDLAAAVVEDLSGEGSTGFAGFDAKVAVFAVGGPVLLGVLEELVLEFFVAVVFEVVFLDCLGVFALDGPSVENEVDVGVAFMENLFAVILVVEDGADAGAVGVEEGFPDDLKPCVEVVAGVDAPAFFGVETVVVDGGGLDDMEGVDLLAFGGAFAEFVEVVEDSDEVFVLGADDAPGDFVAAFGLDFVEFGVVGVLFDVVVETACLDGFPLCGGVVAEEVGEGGGARPGFASNVAGFADGVGDAVAA